MIVNVKEADLVVGKASPEGVLRDIPLACQSCPWPEMRDRGLCSVCATVLEDSEGQRFVSLRPVGLVE
jgi:hypothetical protein